MVTSRNIAKKVGRNHFHILRDIRRYEGYIDWRWSFYIDRCNRVRPSYILDEENTIKFLEKISITVNNSPEIFISLGIGKVKFKDKMFYTIKKFLYEKFR